MIIPPGWRYLEVEEDVQVGDMAWNVIGRNWELISEAILATALAFGGPAKRMFLNPPIRKIEGYEPPPTAKKSALYQALYYLGFGSGIYTEPAGDCPLCGISLPFHQPGCPANTNQEIKDTIRDLLLDIYGIDINLVKG